MDRNNEQLLQFWSEGKFIQLGELLCSLIPIAQQPMWFSTLLEIASPYGDKGGVIDNFLEAIYSEEWVKGSKEYFHSLRKVTLEYERVGEDDRRKYCTIILAENIAKLTFNCSNKWQPGFDVDSGHWVPENVKNLIDCSNNKKINEALLNHLLMINL